jgi:hypothetical protein
MSIHVCYSQSFLYSTKAGKYLKQLSLCYKKGTCVVERATLKVTYDHSFKNQQFYQ